MRVFGPRVIALAVIALTVLVSSIAYTGGFPASQSTLKRLNPSEGYYYRQSQESVRELFDSHYIFYEFEYTVGWGNEKNGPYYAFCDAKGEAFVLQYKDRITISEDQFKEYGIKGWSPDLIRLPSASSSSPGQPSGSRPRSRSPPRNRQPSRSPSPDWGGRRAQTPPAISPQPILRRTWSRRSNSE